MAGRSYRLTDDGRARLLDAIRAGHTRQDAARAAGIGVSTLFRYLQDGRASKSGRWRELWEAVKEAESEAARASVSIIRTAAQENWTAAAWWLERRRPGQWAKRTEHRIAGHDGGPITLNLVERVVGDDTSSTNGHHQDG